MGEQARSCRRVCQDVSAAAGGGGVEGYGGVTCRSGDPKRSALCRVRAACIVPCCACMLAACGNACCVHCCADFAASVGAALAAAKPACYLEFCLIIGMQVQPF